MSVRRNRRAASAVEVLVASAILATAFVPIYTVMTGSRRSAYLNELHILGRRRTYRALHFVRGQPWEDIRAAATGEAPPDDVPGLPPEGKEIPLPLPSAAEDVAREDAPGDMLRSYEIRVGKMPVEVYFHELGPGLGRLSAVCRWVDPVTDSPRSFASVLFVEDPFWFRGRR